MSSKTLHLSRSVVRSFTSTATKRAAAAEVEKGYTEIKKVQEHFQKKDGKPVFLKGNVMDQVLYRVTVGFSLLGIAGMGSLFYDLAVPKTE